MELTPEELRKIRSAVAIADEYNVNGLGEFANMDPDEVEEAAMYRIEHEIIAEALDLIDRELNKE